MARKPNAFSTNSNCTPRPSRRHAPAASRTGASHRFRLMSRYSNRSKGVSFLNKSYSTTPLKGLSLLGGSFSPHEQGGQDVASWPWCCTPQDIDSHQQTVWLTARSRSSRPTGSAAGSPGSASRYSPDDDGGRLFVYGWGTQRTRRRPSISASWRTRSSRRTKP